MSIKGVGVMGGFGVVEAASHPLSRNMGDAWVADGVDFGLAHPLDGYDHDLALLQEAELLHRLHALYLRVREAHGVVVERNQTCFPDLGEIEESKAGYSAFSTCSPNSAFSLSNPSGVDVGVGDVSPFKLSRLREGRIMPDSASMVNGQFENVGDSGIGDASLHTDTSVNVDKDDINQTFRRLAQNREAARKSRLKKKAYVQQLENSQLKLNQMEQELKRTRQQVTHMYNGYTGDKCQKLAGTGIHCDKHDLFPPFPHSIIAVAL
ncbi:hypothetical protein Sjap_015044 [Stephania japonica]|uniref:BZIP domain-containing protein n=1 Tax=Stephania japonica TaxID=461633 RepID=A0AAP0IIP0_9MAGN